jgi:hypothetical protein
MTRTQSRAPGVTACFDYLLMLLLQVYNGRGGLATVNLSWME